MVRTKKGTYALHKSSAKRDSRLAVWADEELTVLVDKRIEQASFQSRSNYLQNLILNDLLVHNLIPAIDLDKYIKMLNPLANWGHVYTKKGD